MDDAMTAPQFKNLDRRLAHVEQILPTLATREDLKALATREELTALATKEELRLAVAQLATKEELKALEATLRQEIRDEGERSRRHTTILIEHQDDKINLLIDHVQSLRPRRPGE